jgi:Skp family chaperone for outer membrane proteins
VGDSPSEASDKAAGEPGARVRDSQGRFAPKDPEIPKFADLKAPDAAGAPAAPPTDLLAEAPQSWAPERRADWAKVPPEVRDYLHQREGELQQGFQKVAQRSNVAESVLSEFMPYADTLQAEGATPVTAIRTLLQTAHALRTGGQEYRKAIIMSLAQQYGVDLQSEYNPQQAAVEAQLQALSTEKMYGMTQIQQREQQQVQEQFNAFANDPKNEFFPKVRGVMAQLVSSGIAQDLPSAYQMAVGLVPEVRQELQNREWATREAAQRKAAVSSMSVSGTPNGPAAPQPAGGGMSLRDSIAAQMSGVNP